jgi:hypothetical protein
VNAEAFVSVNVDSSHVAVVNAKFVTMPPLLE